MTTAQKTALVTGCSEATSLGAALFLNLKAKGYRVFATARRLNTLKALEAEGCDVLELDVSDPGSIQRAASEVERIAGRLDLLINNASVMSHSPILDSDMDKVRDLYEVNVFGPMRIAQAFSNLLVRTANDPAISRKKGDIVGIINVGSCAWLGTPFCAAYGGSKAALYSMSQSLRFEMENLNVKVTYCHLGATNTAMSNLSKNVDVMDKNKVQTFYPNWNEIYSATEKSFTEVGATAPSAAQTAALILDHHYAGNYPGGGIYGGAGAFAVKHLMPWMPQSMIDGMFRKFGLSGMVKTPRF